MKNTPKNKLPLSLKKAVIQKEILKGVFKIPQEKNNKQKLTLWSDLNIFHEMKNK